MYINLLKLNANKLFENSEADLSWLLFKRSLLVKNICWAELTYIAGVYF